MASKKTIKKVEAPIDQHETFVSLQKSFADSDLSVEEKLRTLYELQKADSEIDNILQLRGELPREVEALEEEIAQMKVKSAEISALVEQLNRNIADAKLAIADHESTIEKYQRQLEAITNSREYDSLNKEIENQDLLRQIEEKKITDTKAAILEHRGRLDNPDYVENTIWKTHLYAAAGVFPGYNLLLSEETGDSPLRTKDVEAMIRAVFL